MGGNYISKGFFAEDYKRGPFYRHFCRQCGLLYDEFPHNLKCPRCGRYELAQAFFYEFPGIYHFRCMACRAVFGKIKIEEKSETNVYYAPEYCGNCGGRGCMYCDYEGVFLVAQPSKKCGNCGGRGCMYCEHTGWKYYKKK